MGRYGSGYGAASQDILAHRYGLAIFQKGGILGTGVALTEPQRYMKWNTQMRNAQEEIREELMGGDPNWKRVKRLSRNLALANAFIPGVNTAEQVAYINYANNNIDAQELLTIVMPIITQDLTSEYMEDDILPGEEDEDDFDEASDESWLF